MLTKDVKAEISLASVGSRENSISSFVLDISETGLNALLDSMKDVSKLAAECVTRFISGEMTTRLASSNHLPRLQPNLRM